MRDSASLSISLITATSLDVDTDYHKDTLKIQNTLLCSHQRIFGVFPQAIGVILQPKE
jgi:hypothetical protein